MALSGQDPIQPSLRDLHNYLIELTEDVLPRSR